jgi:hypothetical protein
MGDGSDSGTPWDQSGPPHFFSKWPITKPKIFASFLWKIVHQNDQLVEGSSKLVFPRAGSLYVRISQSRDSLHNPGLCLHNPGIMETTHPQPPTTPLQLDEKNGMESEIFRLHAPRPEWCWWRTFRKRGKKGGEKGKRFEISPHNIRGPHSVKGPVFILALTL